MKIWLASGNRHKYEEVATILGPRFFLQCTEQLADWREPVENGNTYLENARIKARALWDRVQAPVCADDSGLEVDALGQRPGLQSSRYSAPNPTSEKNIEKLLAELRGIPAAKRTARFVCILVYLDQEGRESVFEGILHGVIGETRAGCGGFGFDPVFFLPNYDCTVAELAADEKNRISHRGQAVAALRQVLLATGNMD